MYLIHKILNLDNIYYNFNYTNKSYILYIKDKNVHLNGLILNIKTYKYIETENYYQVYFDIEYLTILLQIQSHIKKKLSTFTLIRNNRYIIINKSNNIKQIDLLGSIYIYINSIVLLNHVYIPIITIL